MTDKITSKSEFLKKALNISQCLSVIKYSKLYKLFFRSSHSQFVQAYQDYVDIINWQEDHSKKTMQIIKILDSKINNLEQLVTDLQLTNACKSHDLEATKRELQAMKDKYET